MGFERVSILGVGLLGTSLARAMKKRSLCSHVTGHGRNEDNLKRAQSLGYIDTYHLDPATACEGADLVILASPVETFTGLMRKIAASLKPGALVIDVGSIKGALCRELGSMVPEGVSFVGCHPIAGGERSGIGASDENLFEGALCIITDQAGSGAVSEVAGLWERLGAVVEYMDPDEHDRVYALVSHFPHLAAYAMVNAVGDADDGALRLAGPGFLDSTRIAMSSPELWKNISLMNRDNIARFLDLYIENLKTFADRLREGDAQGLFELMDKAQKLRSSIDGR